MKRTPLKRRTGLKRTKKLVPINRERAAKRRLRDFGELADFVRAMGCWVCRSPGPSDPAHVRSRGAGGHAWNDDGTGNLLPMCRHCHGLQHNHGWRSFLGLSAVGPETVATHIGQDFKLQKALATPA